MQQPNQEHLALPGQTAAAYIEKRWGGPTRAVPVQKFTGISAFVTQFLPRNPRRMQVTFVNPSANSIFIWTDQDPSTGSDNILVPPFSGGVSFLIDEDGEMVTYGFQGNAIGVGGQLSIWEIIRK